MQWLDMSNLNSQESLDQLQGVGAYSRVSWQDVSDQFSPYDQRVFNPFPGSLGADESTPTPVDPAPAETTPEGVTTQPEVKIIGVCDFTASALTDAIEAELVTTGYLEPHLASGTFSEALCAAYVDAYGERPTYESLVARFLPADTECLSATVPACAQIGSVGTPGWKTALWVGAAGAAGYLAVNWWRKRR